MNDRLAELRGDMPLFGGGDVEAGPFVVESASSPFMKTFYEDVEGIKKAMATVKQNIAQIERHHGECLTAISAEQGRASTAALDELMRTTNATATQVRNKLKSMDAENKDFVRRNEGSSEARIRSNMHGTLTRKFVDVMAEYQELQTKYKNKYREKVARQYKIVKPSVTQQEIDAAFEAGDNQPDLFAQQIVHGRDHAMAKAALSDIQERHKDIRNLEASIAELHQLFLDMSTLVEAQQPILDHISYTVGQAVDYTERGVGDLRDAARYQRKARKKMCMIICCVLIILLCVSVPMIANALKDRSRRLDALSEG